MKNVKRALLALSVIVVACATARAQQPRIFDWQPADNETVRLDPANFHSARTYHPGPEGGNIHVDVTSQKPVTVFMAEASAWNAALQNPGTMEHLQRACLQQHVMQATYVCNLPPAAMTLVIQDERYNPNAVAAAELGLVLNSVEQTQMDHGIAGSVAAMIGNVQQGRRFTSPNDVRIQYYRWDCAQNCVQPEFRWIEQVKEKYDLTSFLKVYGGFTPDHDQTQVDIKIKAPVPMIVAMLPSNAANELHARPEVLESALEKSPCQQRGVQKMQFQCTFNAADGPQSLIVVPEDTGKVPRKKTEIEMQVVKCVDNCQLIETGQKSAAAGDAPKQN